MRGKLRLALVAVGALATTGVLVFVLGGFYNLTAVQQHPAWVFRAVAIVRDTIVRLEAREVAVPAYFTPIAESRDVALYQKHCVQCHGAPGVAPEEFALGMMPVPSNLVAAARERPPEEIYWFIDNGLKMTGMPAWHMRMSEADIWRITALVEAMPSLSPTEYKGLLAAAPQQLDAMTTVAEADPLSSAGDPKRGKTAVQVHGCLQCHMVEGIVGRTHLQVGPPLDEAGARKYIAGVLPNTPDNMVRWIMNPQDVDPLSAMPDLGVSENLARDMTAYLYSVADGNAADYPPPIAD